MYRRKLLTTLVTLAALGSVAVAQAQDGSWPTRPVTMVVPFPPGGGTDILARAIANRLQEQLGKPVIIDNKPGAGGILGTQQVARAPADGHTVVIGITNTFAINPTFYRGKDLNYDPVGDFQPVAFLADSPHVLVIHPDTPATTYQEYVAYAKANRGKLSYASYGNGSTSHLITEMLKKDAGLDLVHVPYKGIPPALSDVMGNQVSMLVSSAAPAIPLIQAGRLRGIAVYGDRRIDTIPEVPTIGELGHPDAALTLWYGLFAPSGTPKAVVDRLNREVNAAIATKEVAEVYAKAGIYSKPMSADEFTRFVKAETNRWGGLVTLSGAKAE